MGLALEEYVSSYGSCSGGICDLMGLALQECVIS